MGLKERGFTVGDLLIVLIIIISTTFIIKKLNQETQTGQNYLVHEEKIYFN